MPGKIKTGILLTVTILLGFLRGYLFGNINWIYKTLTVNRPNQALREFHFLLKWTPSEIVILKWGLTFFFFALFAFMSWIIIRRLFGNPVYNRITLLVFGALIAISALLYLIYTLTGYTTEMYGIIRTLMGLGQSILPLMVLIIIFKFFPSMGDKNG